MDLTSRAAAALAAIAAGPDVVLPGVWTFWADTITGAVPLGPVAPHAFTFARALSTFGKGEVTMPATSPALPPSRLLALWSWRLWAFYDGQPLWCGVPTGLADNGDATVSLTLTELPGYLAKRQFDLVDGARYDQVEQTVIARDLAEPVGDVGVQIVTEPGPGFLRDRSYEYLESQSRAQLLTNLSEVISGPEFRTEYAMTPAGRPACTLRIAYPRVGGPSGVGATVPGNAIGYSAAWDADAMRTRTFAAGELPEGAPEGAVRPVIVVDRPQAGLPRLDEVDDWPGTVLETTLRERANTAATANARPALDLSVSVGEASPPLTRYMPGDDVTLHVTSPLLEGGGLDVTGTLREESVNAAEGTVAWTVTVDSPPPWPRGTLTNRLGAIDALTQGVFRRRRAPV
jgi:hypothetical protein